MKITCIAIDDEPLAVKKISAYIQKTPFLELVAECRSAFEAMEIINNRTIQLIFIDINMPDLSGLEFVKSLADKPYIVFTTAYSEYAVEGFQVDAADYLLKPVTYSSFLKAANKVKNLIELNANRQKESIRATTNHLFVKSDYKLIRIELDDIKYIESQHEYIKIHLINSAPVMTQLSMKAIEEQLPSDRFMRVHRSYIVNLKKISVVERNRIVFDGKVYLPVSDQYKEIFQEYIDGNFV
ncbi:MAG: LytTR family DNA-binding domain-containing protein [Bacteroidetes bacterium]|nr:LytTR family DNA-binding domain-containing protein [Bacteroidota bacterium]